jgi:hypothetical protein
MAMLGRWPAWCQLSCWRSIGTNGLMSGSKATGTEAQSTPLPARCDHLVIVAGINVPGQSSLLLGP